MNSCTASALVDLEFKGVVLPNWDEKYSGLRPVAVGAGLVSFAELEKWRREFVNTDVHQNSGLGCYSCWKLDPCSFTSCVLGTKELPIF